MLGKGGISVSQTCIFFYPLQNCNVSIRNEGHAVKNVTLKFFCIADLRSLNVVIYYSMLFALLFKCT